MSALDTVCFHQKVKPNFWNAAKIVANQSKPNPGWYLLRCSETVTADSGWLNMLTEISFLIAVD